MIFWILKWFLINLSIIIFIHHIFLYLKSSLTIPKVKDAVQREYVIPSLENTPPSTEDANMQDELTAFLQNLQNN